MSGEGAREAHFGPPPTLRSVRGLRQAWRGLGLGATATHVTHLTAAAGVSQVVLLLSQIVLAGLYPAEDFGRFYVATAVGALAAILATGRYEMAIPLAADDAEAGALARWCLAASSVVALALAVGLAVALSTGGLDTLTEGLGSAVWFVPAITWSVAIFTTLRMLQGRRGRFASLALSNVTATLAQAFAQLGAGVAGFTHAGLPGGYVVGRLAGTGQMARDSWRVLSLRGTAMRVVVRRWRRFPLFNTWPALLGGISASAVAPIVAAMYGIGFAGWYGYAAYVLAAPAALLGQAVSSVFFPTMARLDREGTPARGTIERMATALTLVSIPVFGTVVLLGPELFALLPTGTWRPAGVVAALLAPWLAASFVSSPMSSYATVRDQLGRLLVFAIVEATLRLAGLATGLWWDDPMVGVATYSAAGVAICVYSLGWTLRLAGSGLASWAGTMRRVLLGALVIVLAALAVRWTGHAGATVAAGAVGVVALAALTVRPLLALRVRT